MPVPPATVNMSGAAHIAMRITCDSRYAKAAQMAVQVTLKRAFDGQSLPALVVKILRGRYPPVPTQYSSSLRGLVDSLLKQKPQVLPAGPSKSTAACLKGSNQRALCTSWSACPPCAAQPGAGRQWMDVLSQDSCCMLHATC